MLAIVLEDKFLLLGAALFAVHVFRERVKAPGIAHESDVEGDGAGSIRMGVVRIPVERGATEAGRIRETIAPTLATEIFADGIEGHLTKPGAEARGRAHLFEIANDRDRGDQPPPRKAADRYIG